MIYLKNKGHYSDIEKNDWIGKTGVEIRGGCSKFKGEAKSNACGYTFGEILIENGIIKRGKGCDSW